MAVVLDNNDVTGKAHLIKIINHVPGDLIPLTSNDITIGRNSCNVSIQDINVSRYHCRLKREGKNWFLIDLKSLNGTYIDNERLKPNTPYPLNNERVISIGPPVNACTTFLFKTTEDEEAHGITTEDNKRKDESSDSDFSNSIAINSMLKRRFDPETEDKTMSDSQRKNTVPPIISPSLDEDDDGVSDSSISSMDSLKTRIRKMTSVKRKKRESRNGNNLIVPSTSVSEFKSCENHQQNYTNESSTSGVTAKKFKKQEQNSCLREEFVILNALCNEPESSSIGAISENESSESLLNDNVMVGEPHVPSTEQDQKMTDEENAKRLAYEVQKAKLDALKKELEVVEAQARKNRYEELEKVLENFTCIICVEVIDEPVVLNCSHTMCQYCLSKWKMKRKRCPICREKIVYEIKNLLIKNFIEKTIELMDAEYQASRKELVSKRQKEMESWPKKKKKKKRSYNPTRRNNSMRTFNEYSEGSSNRNEQSVINLSDLSSESD